MSDLDLDFLYYADRARQERYIAARAASRRACHIHRSMANLYVLRAMREVLTDCRRHDQTAPSAADGDRLTSSSSSRGTDGRNCQQSTAQT